MEEKKLKVGDVIYRNHYDRLSRFSIDRITPTMAFAGTTKFRLWYSGNGFLQEIGAGRFSTISFHIETEELNKRYTRQQILAKFDAAISNCKNKLTTDQMTRILQIINEVRP